MFFSDADRALYLELLTQSCAEAEVACLAWCLMDNHVHLILLPETRMGCAPHLRNRTGATRATSTSPKGGAGTCSNPALPAIR
ncbi:hypothetical protein [Sandaracinobacteroides hominis]|uniref:hypothetical protein n=1 Tax=Sandaracinobacteroides hominis TaxID=2780086 RepID=UPI0038B4A7BC